MIRSTVEAKDTVLRVADFLEGLKDAEANQEGTLSSFTASSLWLFSWICDVFGFAGLIAELKKALSNEKAARSVADRALDEEHATRQTTEQSLLSSNEANTLLANELHSTQDSLTTTTDMMSSNSSTLDHSVIREQQMKIRLESWEEKHTACEERLTVANDKLKAAEEKMNSQGQLLDSAQQALSKSELSSLAVANAVVLMKNHLPDLDVKIIDKDLTVDDAEREILVNDAYDAIHHFLSLYDFSSLAESDDNISLGAS
jgi:chromosome segregation ATPase